jgi:hypothetical protein
MPEARLPLLVDWQNFYIIIGAAAATLTGLMFIVITLMAGIEIQRSAVNAALDAFNTPTVVHFCAVLLLGGILSAPWRSYASVAIVLTLTGLAGVIYFMIVRRRMRSVPDYHTRLKDWVWYWLIPFVAYIVLALTAAVLPAIPVQALYIIAAVMIALLFIGIHNAWDLVTYLAIDRAHPES